MTTKCIPPILVIPTKNNEINKSICESVNNQINKIENKSSMYITSPQSFMYQSPTKFMYQSPQTFVNQSPQTFVNQSPQTFISQTPQTFMYHSPQTYMYQTPRIFSDSPLIFSTSPLIFCRSPILNSRSSSPSNYYTNKLPISYSPLIGNWKSDKESLNININDIIAKMYNNNRSKIVNNFVKLNMKFKFPSEYNGDINQYKIFIKCPSSIFWVHLSYSIVTFIMYGMKGERSIHSLTNEEIDSINKNTDICGLLGVYLRKNKTSCGCNGDIMFNNEDIAKQFIKFGKKQLSIDFKIDLNDQFFKIEWHKESIISYPDIIQSDIIQSDIIQSDIIQSDIIQSDIIQSDIIQSDIIQSDIIQSDIIQSDIIQSDIIQSDDVQSDDIQSDDIKLSIIKKENNLILPIGQNSSFKKFTTKNMNNLINNNLPKGVQNLNNIIEKEKIYEFYIKKLLIAIKKKIGNKIHDIEDEININSYVKNLNLKFNLEINDKEEHIINGNKIISYLSELINNPNKQSLFFKKFQVEMKNLSEILYFHLSCSIKENIFILDITKKYN
jgi:hypothetical protein